MIFLLVIFDVTNKKSFEVIETMIETFNHNNKNPVKKFILVGNKADEGEPRQVLEQEAKEFAESYGIPYYELSVKKGTKIDNIFFTEIEETCRNIDKKVWGEAKDLDLEKYGIKKI